MNQQPRFGFVVEYVKEIDAARRFYEEVLGLRVERTHSTFVQFEHFALASDEPMAGDGEPEIYWLVEDASGAYESLPECAEVVLPLREVPFGKVFGLRDPDGRNLFLLELGRDRPSRSVD